MTNRTALARQALRAALQLRRTLSIARECPVNAFDVAQMSGLDVRFLDTPTLQGMFVRDPGPRVLLPSLKHRPRARVLFSCAHEIGHHQLGHGTKANEYLADRPRDLPSSAEEFLANTFAGHLLMPRAAVLEAFQKRNWNASHPTATQVFLVSGELGVGFVTLLGHMCWSLELIPRVDHDQLIKVTPKSLKIELAGDSGRHNVFVVDSLWHNDVPIDLECKELLVMPINFGMSCSLLKLELQAGDTAVFVAMHSGHETVTVDRKKITIRVARQHYVGPYRNRYLSDPDEH